VDFIGFGKSVARDVTTELRKWMTCRKNQQGLGIFLVFIIVMAGMFSYQASAIKVGPSAAAAGGGGGKPVSFEGWTATTGSTQASGSAAEAQPGTATGLQLTDKNLGAIQFVLRWKDEPDSYPRHQNQPDTLGVEAVAPWGENKTASGTNVYVSTGGEGTVTVSFDIIQKRYNGDNGTGDWSYTVFCTNAGDHMPKNVGLLKWNDLGNTYTLDITWTYYTKPAR